MMQGGGEEGDGWQPFPSPPLCRFHNPLLTSLSLYMYQLLPLPSLDSVFSMYLLIHFLLVGFMLVSVLPVFIFDSFIFYFIFPPPIFFPFKAFVYFSFPYFFFFLGLMLVSVLSLLHFFYSFFSFSPQCFFFCFVYACASPPRLYLISFSVF